MQIFIYRPDLRPNKNVEPEKQAKKAFDIADEVLGELEDVSD